jgi:predicted  nucleic acid-binding Zn-ribbon protein
MNAWTEYEARIAAALERIRTDLAALGVAAADSGELAALRQELEEERLANAQLEERVRLLKDRQETRIRGLEAALAEAKGNLAALDQAAQGLSQSNADLRATVADLRSALTEGVADPELVNRAMQAELEALGALRAADRAEVDAILSELAPLVEEVS